MLRVRGEAQWHLLHLPRQAHLWEGLQGDNQQKLYDNPSLYNLPCRLCRRPAVCVVVWSPQCTTPWTAERSSVRGITSRRWTSAWSVASQCRGNWSSSLAHLITRSASVARWLSNQQYENTRPNSVQTCKISLVGVPFNVDEMKNIFCADCFKRYYSNILSAAMLIFVNLENLPPHAVCASFQFYLKGARLLLQDWEH